MLVLAILLSAKGARNENEKERLDMAWWRGRWILLLVLVIALLPSSPESAENNSESSTPTRAPTARQPTRPSGGSGFQERLSAGADCAELFRIRNLADPSSPDVPNMNSSLREVGCFSSSSTRTR